MEIKVWRKSGEAQNPSCLKSSVKFLKSVMIWGAVTSAGVAEMHLYTVSHRSEYTPHILVNMCIYTHSVYEERNVYNDMGIAT